MIRSLRKRHFQIWITWAILLPVGIFMSWLAIPNRQPVRLLQASQPGQLPVLFLSADKKNYWVNIRTNNDTSSWQLEWINKYPLTVPSAVIYQKHGTGFEPAKNEQIGRIEAEGSYLFTLQKAPGNTVFFLYDFIHETVIDTIGFKNSKKEL